MATREKARFGKVMLEGVKKGTSDEVVLMENEFGHIVIGCGSTVPSDGSIGYCKACMFIKTDAGAGTGGMYLNKGTRTSCQFTLATQA